LIYLDAFVSANAQALIDLVPLAEQQRLLDSVKTGDGWRVTPNPTPPDTSSEDLEWIGKYRMPQSVKCLEQPLRLQAELGLPRVFIHCTRYADKKPFAQFASRTNARLDGNPMNLTLATVQTSPRRLPLWKCLGGFCPNRNKDSPSAWGISTS